ncbi:unnamed protein product [Camellia sinensis]
MAAEGLHELATNFFGGGDLKEALQKLASFPSRRTLAELRASVFEAIEEEDMKIEKEEGLPPALLGSCNDCAKQLHASPSAKYMWKRRICRRYLLLQNLKLEREDWKGKLLGEKRKKIDDSVDMVVSKEGFDDEDKLLRTVFVGNLTLKVKKKALFKEFSQFGEVESVRIRSIPLLDTKKPRKGAIIQKKINDVVDSVHAYIVFETEQAAQASLAHNMAVIRVDRACPPRKKLKGDNAPLYDNKRMVFVGNLPFDVKDKLADVRKPAEVCIGEIFRVCGPDAVCDQELKDIQGPALAIVLERLKHSGAFQVGKSGSKVHEPDEHPPQHIS